MKKDDLHLVIWLEQRHQEKKGEKMVIGKELSEV